MPGSIVVVYLCCQQTDSCVQLTRSIDVSMEELEKCSMNPAIGIREFQHTGSQNQYNLLKRHEGMGCRGPPGKSHWSKIYYTGLANYCKRMRYFEPPKQHIVSKTQAEGTIASFAWSVDNEVVQSVCDREVSKTGPKRFLGS